jgi:glycosyltransferase involved in cell wall biosynthesis
MTAPSGISLVICCFNSATRLPKVLPALARLDPVTMPWEVLVVDNASTDDTARVATHQAVQHALNLRVVREERRGTMFARLRGVAAARHELVIFVDDDNWLESDYLRAAVAALSDDPSVAACGAFGIADSAAPLPGWFQRFQGAYAVGPQDVTSSREKSEIIMLWSAGLTVRRRALLELLERGFQPLLTGRTGETLVAGEDSELCLALRLAGWKLRFEPRLRYRHLLPEHRLHWTYLRQLHRAFGDASVSLDSYLFALSQPSARLPTAVSHSWPYQVAGALKVLSHLPWRAAQLPEGSGEALRREYFLGRFLRLLRLGFSYPAEVRNLNLWCGPSEARSR